MGETFYLLSRLSTVAAFWAESQPHATKATKAKKRKKRDGKKIMAKMATSSGPRNELHDDVGLRSFICKIFGLLYDCFGYYSLLSCTANSAPLFWAKLFGQAVKTNRCEMG